MGLPLANFAPLLSLKVTSHVDPESLISQLCARPGFTVERSAPSNLTRVSYALWARSTPVNSYATAGSSEMRSLVSAYQTSVLAAAPPDGCGVPVAPIVPPGPQAAASSTSVIRMEKRRTFIGALPWRVVLKPSTALVARADRIQRCRPPR